MSIILKENEWAEQMIRDCELGKKPSETLQRVARYYLDNGYSKKEVRDKLDVFLIQCNPLASLPKWSDALDYAVKRALKFNAVNIDYIDISATEMAVVDARDRVQERRLAFTLLCLSKYWNIVNPQMNSWVVNKESEIMNLANVHTSSKRQGDMYFCMRRDGLLQFSKKIDNTNVRVLFGDNNEPIMRVSDFRNLGYQYMMFKGGPFFVCENCGIITRVKHPDSGRPQKYCNTCAVKIQTKQKVDYVMRKKNT